MKLNKIIIATSIVVVLTAGILINLPRIKNIFELAEVKNKENSVSLEIIPKLSENAVCDFSLENPNEPLSIIEGKFYILSSSIRFDLTVTDKTTGEVTQNSYLEKDGYGYTWFKGKGVKFKLESGESIFSEKNISPDIVKLIDLSNNFSCSTQKLNSEVFNIPQDVDFSDAKENVEDVKNKIDNVTQKMESELENYCGKCNALQNSDLIDACRNIRGCE